jgi:hypothetical protein
MIAANKMAAQRRPDPRHIIAKFPYLIGTANISFAGRDSATARRLN